MKKYLMASMAAGIAAALSLTACTPAKTVNSNGVKITQERVSRTLPLSDFSSIDIDRQFYTVITVGSAYSVKVDAPKDFFEHSKIKVSDHTLEVGYDSNLNFEKAPKNTKYNTTSPVVTVTMPTLESLDASGQSAASISGQLQEKLKASVSGQSWLGISGQQTLKNLSLDITGQSSVDLDSIDANQINIDCSGQSAINIALAQCINANIDCSGQSATGIKTLDANKIMLDASGQASINFGNLTAVSGTVEASGMSAVTARKSAVGNVSVSSSGLSSVTIKK